MAIYQRNSFANYLFSEGTNSSNEGDAAIKLNVLPFSVKINLCSINPEL